MLLLEKLTLLIVNNRLDLAVAGAANLVKFFYNLF